MSTVLEAVTLHVRPQGGGLAARLQCPKNQASASGFKRGFVPFLDPHRPCCGALYPKTLLCACLLVQIYPDFMVGKIKCTKGNIDLGCFWYAIFWVPPSPSPISSNTCLWEGGGVHPIPSVALCTSACCSVWVHPAGWRARGTEHRL